MNVWRTNCFSIELARTRISNALTYTQHCFKLRSAANAPHGFDNPLGANPPVPTKADQSVRDCKIREDDKAILINEATNAQFTYNDECVRIGPLVGADPEATQVATAAVTEFVRAVVATK